MKISFLRGPLHLAWEFKDQQFGIEDAGVDQSNVIPEIMILHQNYPNPFNPVTNITFMVETYGYASIRIYDIKGRLVETLVEEQLPSGEYEVHWDASDLPSGVYFIRLTGSNKSITKKAVLLK